MGSVSVGLWILSVMPIVVLAICLIGFKLPMAKSAAISLVLAVIFAVAVAHNPLANIAVDVQKGLWNTAIILFVIWPAIGLYEVLDHAGAFRAITGTLTKLTQDELVLIILVGWVFSSFVQGVTGFGIPVAITAPLMFALGVDKIRAIVIPLLGHAWANSMGTLSVAFDAMLVQAQVEATHELLLYSALFLGLVCIVGGVALVLVADGVKGLKHAFPLVVLIGLTLAGGELLVVFLSPTIAVLVPTIVIFLILVILFKLGIYTKPYQAACISQEGRAQEPKEAATPATTMSFGMAVIGFLLLTTASLVLLVVPAIQEFSQRFTVSFAFPETVTGLGYTVHAIESYAPIAPFTHAGFIILCSTVLAALLYLGRGHMNRKDISSVVRSLVKKASKTSLGIVLLLLLSQIMNGSGAMNYLAQGIAATSGKAYAFLSPFVGLLGAFMGSSNMSSNILFTTFQQQMAQLLAIDPAIFLAAQTSSGAAGVAIAPSNILLACITLGIVGSEGVVLKRVLPYVVIEIVLLALMCVVMVFL